MTYLKTLTACTAICAILLTGCTSQVTVSTDYTDFDAIKTYNWVTDGPQRDAKISDLIYDRIEKEITRNLTVKGLKGASDSELLINYSVLSESKIDIDQHMVYDGYAPGFAWHNNYGYGASTYYTFGARYERMETNIDQYLEGTLIIDILDAKTNKIVWRGIGSKRLPEKMNKDDRNTLVAEVVNAILENYPPKKN